MPKGRHRTRPTTAAATRVMVSSRIHLRLRLAILVARIMIPTELPCARSLASVRASSLPSATSTITPSVKQNPSPSISSEYAQQQAPNLAPRYTLVFVALVWPEKLLGIGKGGRPCHPGGSP